MKTPEELNTLKEEVETLNKKLNELSEEELSQVSGGGFIDYSPRPCPFCESGTMAYYPNRYQFVCGSCGATW